MDEEPTWSEFDSFSYDRDMTAVLRVWAEAGWFDGEERQKRYIEDFFQANDGKSVVARLNDEVEAVVHRSLGSMHFDQTSLSMGGVTAVTTSRIARRLGFASRLTARTVAHLADEGAAIALLGMFEQGFYDRFGFGNGAYENRVYVYPADLNIPVAYRTPERFDFDMQADELHEAMVNRMPWHGGIVGGGERLTQAGIQIDDEVATFGYRTDGVLSHYISVSHSGEHGPDKVIGLVYQSRQQCLELFRLIQEWGDQVDVIRVVEPPWLQLQDLMRNPGSEWRRTKGTPNAMRIDADAWWQLRIVDLHACVKALTPQEPQGESVIVVDLDDPIQPHLEGSGYSGKWEPLTGSWRLRFGGSDAGAQRTNEPADLNCSINALSRWWIGAVSASTLEALGEFDAGPDVVAAMDQLTLHLPVPQLGWDI